MFAAFSTLVLLEESGGAWARHGVVAPLTISALEPTASS